MQIRWLSLHAITIFIVVILIVSPTAAITFRTLALTSDSAPGTPSGVAFSGLESPVLNNYGAVAFEGGAENADLTIRSGGIWLASPSGVELVALSGAAAPDTEPGALFEDFFEDSLLNRAGQVAFCAFRTGAVDFNAIWSGVAGDFKVIMREGQHARGTESSTVYAGGAAPLLNNLGQLAFRSSLTGPYVTPLVNDSGIWVGPPGDLNLVVRKGDPAPGMGSGSFFSTLGTAALGLNGLGQIVFVPTVFTPEFGITDAIYVATADSLDLNSDGRTTGWDVSLWGFLKYGHYSDH